jgi:hypothetical protein
LYKITYFNQPAIHFLNTLHLSLYQYALLENSKPADNVALLFILRSLLLRFRIDQIIRGIPVIFKLQSEAKDEKLNNFARQRALASVITLYFHNIAQVLGIPELQQYVEMVSLYNSTSYIVLVINYILFITIFELDTKRAHRKMSMVNLY